MRDQFYALSRALLVLTLLSAAGLTACNTSPEATCTESGCSGEQGAAPEYQPAVTADEVELVSRGIIAVGCQGNWPPEGYYRAISNCGCYDIQCNNGNAPDLRQWSCPYYNGPSSSYTWNDSVDRVQAGTRCDVYTYRDINYGNLYMYLGPGWQAWGIPRGGTGSQNGLSSIAAWLRQ